MDQALGIIKEESGKAFDPAVVEAFFSVIEEVLAFYNDPAISHVSLDV